METDLCICECLSLKEKYCSLLSFCQSFTLKLAEVQRETNLNNLFIVESLWNGAYLIFALALTSVFSLKWRVTLFLFLFCCTLLHVQYYRYNWEVKVLPQRSDWCLTNVFTSKGTRDWQEVIWYDMIPQKKKCFSSLVLHISWQGMTR